MKTVSITLDLTYKEVAAVMAFLNNMPSDFNRSPTRAKQTSDDESPSEHSKRPSQASKASVAPTAGKNVKMPTFGRTKVQIDSFAKQEEKRLEALELKKKLKADRLKEKEEANIKTIKEVKAIKEQQLSTTTLPKKPWEL